MIQFSQVTQGSVVSYIMRENMKSFIQFFKQLLCSFCVQVQYNIRSRPYCIGYKMSRLRLDIAYPIQYSRSLTLYFVLEFFICMYRFQLKRVAIFTQAAFRTVSNPSLRCVGARAYLLALTTRKSWAVGMRNAILRNHLLKLFFTKKSHHVSRLTIGVPWKK